MGTSSREAETDPGTTGSLPWWSAHAAGLIVCHAAYWFGYWHLAYGRSFLSDMREATAVPLFGVCVAVPFTVPVSILVVGLALGAVQIPRRRWALTVAAYLVVAGYWVFLAHVLADVDF